MCVCVCVGVCRSSNGSWKHAGCSLLETMQEAEEEQAKEEEEEEEAIYEASRQMWERPGVLRMRVVMEAGEEEAMGRPMDPRTGRLRRMQPMQKRGGALRGTQFTCFTNTKVQILTQKALLAR